MQECEQNTNCNDCASLNIRFSAKEFGIPKSWTKNSKNNTGHKYCWEFYNRAGR